jgi:hypothetical protein
MITFCGLDVKQVTINVQKARNLTSILINLSMTVISQQNIQALNPPPRLTLACTHREVFVSIVNKH